MKDLLVDDIGKDGIEQKQKQQKRCQHYLAGKEECYTHSNSGKYKHEEASHPQSLMLLGYCCV
eukprot:12220051-Ditylum_brightwellii.AAC.1